MINEFNPMQRLSPLQNFICTIGNLPTSYALSLSYEEQIMWLCNYLENNVMPTLENNTNVTEETQRAFLELQQYVTDYFNNLDVQEEINNKLDEMAENGTLEEIIAQYLTLNGLIIFNTLENMKNAENIVEGSTIKTLGFYSKNDCGGNIYKVRKIVNTDVVDNRTIISLNNYNDLIAEIIFESDEVDIRKLGAKKNEDCSTIITKLLSINKTVIIPRGLWLCNHFSMVNGGKIKGENLNYQVIANDSSLTVDVSVLQCNENCDTFIDCSNCDHISLEIGLSSCESKGYYENAKNIREFVKLDHTCFSYFDLFILCLNNYGLSIKNSWENTFNRLYFRGILAPNVIDIKCIDGNQGISQNIFKDIQSEGFGATILDFTQGLFYHNKINSILTELTPYVPFNRTSTNATVQIPLIKLGDGSNNLLESIQINNFSSDNAEIDDTIYEHSVFYVNADNGSAFGLKVNDLIFDTGVTKPINLTKQEGESGFLSSYLIIDNIINPTAQVIRSSLENMNYYKIGNIFKRYGTTTALSNAKKSITEWYNPYDSSKTPMVSDSSNYNAFNHENSVVKVATTNNKMSAIKILPGEKLKIFYKSDVAIDYEIKLIQRNNTVLDTITGTLPISTNFSLADLYTSDKTSILIASISFSSEGNTYIGDITK